MVKEDFEKLRNGNHGVWSYKMEMMFEKVDLWEIVSGETTMRTDLTGSAHAAAEKKFKKQQRLAKAEIVLRVEDDQLVHTKDDDPHKIWKRLETVHRAKGRSTRMSLRRQLQTIEKAPEQSMQSWVTTVMDLVTRLRALGSKIDDEEIICVLTKLPPAYGPFITALDVAGQDAENPDYVITRLLNEEARQLGLVASDNPEVAMYAHHRNREPSKLERARATAGTPPWKRSGDLKHVDCYLCGEKGHYSADCPHNPIRRALEEKKVMLAKVKDRDKGDGSDSDTSADDVNHAY